MKIMLQGTVSSGFGEGKYFTQLDWVIEQFLTKLGFVPYPGTLNVDIDERAWDDLVRFGQDGGASIEPPNMAFCSAICYEALINNQIVGAVVMPGTTKHPTGKIEIMASVSIKKTLNIVDGDVVTLTLQK